MSGRDDRPLECDALLPPHRLTRRGLIGVAAGLVAAGCSKAPKWDPKKVDSNEGFVEMDLADFPQLATAGGMLAVKPSESRDPVLIMRMENNQFVVMSLRCPHLGCTVRWDNDLQLLVCPCHGSKFDDTGKRLEGVAKQNLQRHQSQLQGTKLQFKMEKV